MAHTHADVIGTRFGRDWHRRHNEPPCDPCRLAWNESCKKRRAEAIGRGWRRPARPGSASASTSCGECGLPVPGAKSAEPLHKLCRATVRARERRVDQAAARLRKAEAGTVSTWVWVVGECAQCLQAFTRHGPASRFCSSKCRRKARQSWKIATRDRIAIYDRDEWTCQLCLEPVDRDLMGTDPMNDWAPSLDHIEPQSWALVPDHSPANLRLAHRWCNSVRGDLRYYTDDDLRVA